MTLNVSPKHSVAGPKGENNQRTTVQVVVLEETITMLKTPPSLKHCGFVFYVLTEKNRLNSEECLVTSGLVIGQLQ